MTTTDVTPLVYTADVAVVGLGPVGGTLVNLLATAGLSVVAIDREPGVMQIPRGVGIDGEIMRAVQSVGLAEKLEPFLKIFRGAEYLDADGNVVATRAPVTGEGDQGWPDRYNVHQPEFEAVLREGMRDIDLVTELVEHEVDEVRNVDGGVEVDVTNLRDGRPVVIKAAYVVGADGGRSVTRRAMGATYDDYGLNQPWIVADFTVTPDADVPELNTHFADPVSPAIYIHVVRDIRRFEFRARPDEDLELAVDPDRIWDRVSRWIDPSNATLLRSAVYTHRSLVADNWREGRILLAGDAAHQTPPFLGQGLCTGVRDAMSLAWRLRDVIRRGAPDSLLDAYGNERAEHARYFIVTATALGSQLTNPTKEAIDSLNSRVGREGRGSAPRLGSGLYDENNGGGYRAPQPRTAAGARLDDLVGYEFGLVVTPAAAAEVAGALGIVEGAVEVVVADGPVLDWLEAAGAAGALVRPDRYLYGIYTQPSDIVTAVEQVALALGVHRQGASV